MGQSSAPCKGCLNRELHCHAICEDYIIWRQRKDELKAMIFQEKADMSNYFEFRRSGVEKRKRNHKPS